MRAALAAGDPGEAEHCLHPLLIVALIALGFIKDHRQRISAQGLPNAGLGGVAGHDEAHVAQQWGDISPEHLGLAGAGACGQPGMWSPVERAADGCKRDPSGHQHPGGWHLPEKPLGKVQHLEGCVVIQWLHA